ncbi:exopolysaccharide biosynthesis protein, partial [Brunnivagina elsteri]
MATLSRELEKLFFENNHLQQSEAGELIATPSNFPNNQLPNDRVKVTLSDLLALAGERTFGFLFVLLSFPSALPIPAPGYSVPFGMAMLLLAGQLLVGRDEPWFPKSWQNHGFDVNKVRQVLKVGLPWLRRIESIS